MNIKPYEKNAKEHPKKQVELIAKSIKRFGWQQPIKVGKDNVIIVGHGRYLAYQEYKDKLGIKEPWVIDEAGKTMSGSPETTHLSLAEEKAYRMADNQINALSSNDMTLIVDELKLLDDELIDLTGFDKDLIIEPEDKDDEVPETPEEPKSKLGDLYELGEHRLLCGSATNQEDIIKITGGNGVEMIYTDPPYGMNYSGRGKNTSNTIMNDDIDPTDFYNVLPEIQERYIWGRVENYKFLLVEPRDTIIWKKNNFGMGRGYRGQYECCFYYGQFSGSDTDVWEQKKDTDYTHPTQKPVELACRAIRNSKPNSVIDVFAGSGSTLLACEKMGVKSYHVELDPKYVDVIVKRYCDYTGNKNIKKNGIDIVWE